MATRNTDTGSTETGATTVGGTFTLQVNGELYDNVSHTAYRTGDVVDAITPFLQAQINEGLAKVV